jgi:hypothetical protein
MGIENLKRWHWILIGLFVGLVVAYVNLGLEPTYPRTMGQQEFERDLDRTQDVNGTEYRVIRDITVHPQVDGVYNKPVQVLTFQKFTFVPKDGVWKYFPYAFRAELPYRPTNDNTSLNTVSAFLSDLGKQDPTIKYKYAWWEERNWSIALWTLGSVIVIGGIWPFVIQLLIGAGLAKPPKPKEEYDLERFGKGKQDAKAAGRPKEMTVAEQDRLRRMNEEMERDLAPSGARVTAGGVVTETQAQITKLTGGPLEDKTAEQEEIEKEYKGEFYPVVKATHVKKKDGEHHDSEKH